MRSFPGLAAAGMMIAAFSIPVRGTTFTDDSMAKKMTGTWSFNQSLSPAFSSSSRGRRGGGALREQQGSAIPTPQRYPQGVRANPINTEPTDAGYADLTPAQRAEVVALRQIGLVLPTVTIDATAEHVTFTDDRGDSECNITGKAEKVRLFGTWLEVKCRWDKSLLRQEYATATNKVTRTWTVDERGLLVMKSKVNGADVNSPEAVAFFDRVR
jgi:hypothetical protein